MIHIHTHICVYVYVYVYVIMNECTHGTYRDIHIMYLYVWGIGIPWIRYVCMYVGMHVIDIIHNVCAMEKIA